METTKSNTTKNVVHYQNVLLSNVEEMGSLTVSERSHSFFFMEGQGYLEKKCREFLVLLKPLILLNNIDKTFFNLQQKYLFLCLLQSELLPLVLWTAGGQSLLYILKEYVHTFHIHKFLSNWTIKLLFFF